MSNIDKGIEAVMAKMPKAEDIANLDDWREDFNVRYKLGFREGALAQRRLLAEEGWVKIPTERGLLDFLYGLTIEVKPGYKRNLARELHRWLQESQSE